MWAFALYNALRRPSLGLARIFFLLILGRYNCAVLYLGRYLSKTTLEKCLGTEILSALRCDTLALYCLLFLNILRRDCDLRHFTLPSQAVVDLYQRKVESVSVKC